MKYYAVLIGLVVILSACGAAEEPLNKEEPKQQNQTSGDVEKPDATTVSGREIIASLEQTTDDTAVRDEQAESVKEDETFTGGYMGEPTEKLAEDLAVQQIEGFAAIEALEQVYGGHQGINKAGVVFLENQTSGAEQPGFWFGVKEPDERLEEWLAILQEQVDAGEILAEPIYVYQSEHSQQDLQALSSEANKVLKPMKEAHHSPDSVSYGIAGDTITGALEINHNFLTEEQQKEIIAAFPDREVIIEQEGRMVPGPGEPDVVYPNPETVAEPSREGYYLVRVDDDSMLAVAAESQDFSSTGGVSKHFSAIDFSFPDAAEKLEVGQRVLIEASGAIAESYPGQGRAIFVEILPAYKPYGADLSETQVVRQALKIANQKSKWVSAINSLQFDEAADRWIVEVYQENETFKVEIEDQ